MLKASVRAEIFDEESHALSTQDANSTDNVAVRASMCRRDKIDLRQGLSLKFARVCGGREPVLRHPRGDDGYIRCASILPLVLSRDTAPHNALELVRRQNTNGLGGHFQSGHRQLRPKRRPKKK